MDKTQFYKIKDKYEYWSSWAVWAEQEGPIKSNIGNLEIFNLDKNPKILDVLNPNIIFVGLNISREVEFPFANFHDSNSRSMDFKLRHAIKDTPAWGGYMTDIIKGYKEVSSNQVRSHLENNGDIVKKNISLFSEELNYIGAQNAVLIAFGNDVYTILRANFKNEYNIIKMQHYAFPCGKDDYRNLFINCIKDHL